jgi:diguanylate cyclase (GGDEF)-like protein
VGTAHGPHRSALLVIASICLAASGAGLLLSSWVAGRVWRVGFSLSWSLIAGLVATWSAHLDGGLASPLLLLGVVPVMYAAMALSPFSVTLCGAATIVELVAVRLSDAHVTMAQQNLLMRFALVLGVVALAVASARHRDRLESQQIILISELQRRAEIDDLTGCVNQRVFHERLGEEVTRAIRYGRPLSVIICDVDLFKTFNDTHGHLAGDSALAAVGASLRSVARSSDVVARLGGDEFAILMPETTAAQAREVAHRINEDLAVSRQTVSLSIGVAELDQGQPSPAGLFQAADAALYDAKGDRPAHPRHGPGVTSAWTALATTAGDHAADAHACPCTSGRRRVPGADLRTSLSSGPPC